MATNPDWDPQQVMILQQLRDAYNRRSRNYNRIRVSEGDFLMVHDGTGQSRTDITLGSADYQSLINAGFLQQTTPKGAGIILPAVKAWDAPPAPAGLPMTIGGQGHAFFIQQGVGNVASGTSVVGGMFVSGELGKLRGELAELLKTAEDPAAKDLEPLVDEAIANKHRGGPAVVSKSLFDSALDRAHKLTGAAANAVKIIEAIVLAAT